jgi:hypothetical protein
LFNTTLSNQGIDLDVTNDGDDSTSHTAAADTPATPPPTIAPTPTPTMTPTSSPTSTTQLDDTSVDEDLQSAITLSEDNITSHLLSNESRKSELSQSIASLLEDEGLDGVDECSAARVEKQIQLQVHINKNKGSSKPALALRDSIDRLSQIIDMDKVVFSSLFIFSLN